MKNCKCNLSIIHMHYFIYFLYFYFFKFNFYFILFSYSFFSLHSITDQGNIQWPFDEPSLGLTQARPNCELEFRQIEKGWALSNLASSRHASAIGRELWTSPTTSEGFMIVTCNRRGSATGVRWGKNKIKKNKIKKILKT